ncbi:MAG: F0F1 ATP synthase subunit B' [Synechococcales cyanobacterium RU_4_20]|nr:F0F1 ATP synthase subunit B' [Synechococcales cyanobacterium RU_4_20]NJR67273.1 F0F1 ATP synthase subunit B' [Synechococcales cyanobacterium CRU_2_2]
MFDFDATLPLMAIQFLLLVVVLDKVFYKPFGKTLDDRSEYVRSKRLGSQERLDQSKKMAEQYEAELAETRKRAQSIVATAQSEAQKLASAQMAEAQQEAQGQREAVQGEIDQQKRSAMATLDGQVDQLSNQILEKLLSTAR